MDTIEQDETRRAVRERYGKIAAANESCCGPSCCSPAGPDQVATALGYAERELDAIPADANLGLGCGNPTAIAQLAQGERVLDLGSGAGMDCFLAARQVGPTGAVVGVDMTAEMIRRARAIAAREGHENVQFRLGEIEHLPVADSSVDVILSNCVINLSPDKQAVFDEAYRVLAPGGRLSISDIVARKPFPPEIRARAEALVGCVAGAATAKELEAMLRAAGFQDVSVKEKIESLQFIAEWEPGADEWAISAEITATKATD